MPPFTLSPYGRTTGSYPRDGPIHLGNLPNSVTNPTIHDFPQKLQTLMERLGVPDGVDPTNLDELPHTGQTIASLFQNQAPSAIIRNLIMNTLENAEFQHFRVCIPEESKDKISGIGVQIMRFNTEPLSEQPEGSSPTFITHQMEKSEIHLERYGQGLELFDDFLLTKDGEMMYKMYIQNLNVNMTFSGMMAVMTALLHCWDPKRQYVSRFGGGTGAQHSIEEMNRAFGILHKRPLSYYALAERAKRCSRAVTANGGFTHLFLSQRALAQIVRGDNFNYEFYRHGPGNLKYLEKGTDALVRMPDGTLIIEEQEYNVSGTDLDPGEKLNMLEQKVSTGRFNVMLVNDDKLLTTSQPDPRRDMHITFLDMDTGNGQRAVQEFVDLVSSAICWQDDGQLNQKAYEKLASPGGAEDVLRELGLGADGLRSVPEGPNLIDIFVVEGAGGRRSVTKFAGNMHVAYLDRNTQARIVAAAERTVKQHMTDDDFRAIQTVLEFVDDNKNADPSSNLAVSFATAFVSPAPDRRAIRNPYGTFDMPAYVRWRAVYRDLIGEAAADAEIPFGSSPVFPGLSSVKHLRTFVSFVQKRPADYFDNFTEDAVRRLHAVVRGFHALEKYARVCRRIWSVDSSPNAFFRKNSLPFWNRSGNDAEDELDGFIQNIILEVGYPTGLVVGAYGAEDNLLPHVNEDRGRVRFGQVVAAYIVEFLDLIGLDNDDFDGGAELTQILTDAFDSGAFQEFGASLFPWNLQDVVGNVAAQRIAAKQFYDRFFENLRVVDNDVDQEPREHVTKIINEQTSTSRPQGIAEDDMRWSVEARTRALVAILKAIQIARDAPSSGATPVVTSDTLYSAAYLALVHFRQVSRGRFVRLTQNEQEVDELQRRAMVDNRLPQDAGQNIVNTTLSFSAKRWREVFQRPRADILAQRLFPADPENPVESWLAPGSEVQDLNDAATAYIAMAARERYHIENTCMGKTSGAAFGNGPNSGRAEMVVEDGNSPHVAGSRYGVFARANNPFRDVPGNIRRIITDNVNDMPGDSVQILSARTQGPHRDFYGGLGFTQEANEHFQWRWKNVLDSNSDPFVMAQHFLFLGTAISRQSFVNLIENGVPPPMGVMTVDPFVTLSMTHAVFAVEGCGRLYYAFPNIATSYSAMHKVTRAFLTVWLKAAVLLPENVFVSEYAAFNGYFGGGSGKIITSIANDHDDYPPPGGYAYDPDNPANRRGDRFVIPLAPSTKLADLPNPLYLPGTPSVFGAYHGLGHWVAPADDGYRRGVQYDTALLVAIICQFHRLARRTPNDFMNAANFLIRGEMIAECPNLVCYLADQWNRNQATGAFDVRTLDGTGALEKLNPNQMHILKGEPGLLQQQHDVTIS